MFHSYKKLYSKCNDWNFSVKPNEKWLKEAFRFFKIFARDFDSQSDREFTFSYAIPTTIIIVAALARR